jgi:hypothetical protein
MRAPELKLMTPQILFMGSNLLITAYIDPGILPRYPDPTQGDRMVCTQSTGVTIVW